MTDALEQGGAATLAQAEALLARVRAEIPLTAAMQLQLAAYDGRTLTLTVPLSPNVNDKGTAFAGSIASLGCITGWCLLTLWGEREIGPCRVAIAEAQFAFRKPLRADFTASVSLPEPGACDVLRRTVARHGKGRIGLRISLANADGEAAVLEGAYALWRTEPA